MGRNLRILQHAKIVKKENRSVPVYELKYFAQVHVNACVVVTVMEANQTRLQIQMKIQKVQLVVKGNAVIQILTNVPVVLTTWLNMALIYRLAQLKTLLLYVVVDLIRSTSMELSATTVSALFNFITGSEKVKEMLLPVAYKPMKSIIGKLEYMRSKHNVFNSLLDTCHEQAEVHKRCLYSSSLYKYASFKVKIKKKHYLTHSAHEV